MSRQEPPTQTMNRRRLILSVLATPVFFALFLFLPAGTWMWVKGWILLLAFLASGAVGFLVIRRVNPELLAARTNPHRGTKRWDQIVLAFFIPAALAIFPVAALDDGRFHWFPVPWWVCLAGYAPLLAGMAVMTWAQAVNRFFEPTVRIQADRGHTVIDAGPYAVVRHPGYAAWLLLSAGVALCLGSLWAFIPAGLSSLALILRTWWEDRTLQAELRGYKEYAAKVRHRLVPGVW